MNSVDVVIRAWRRDDDGDIPNHDLYELRKRIATAFEASGFGVVRDCENDKFQNEHLFPIIDDYYEDEKLFTTFYTIPFPFQIGDFHELVEVNLPRLFELLQDELHLKIDIRVRYY